ncbi:hypothetical protein CYMTET_47903 [Cymbomonas tetramitiformis]|uniref:YkgJ family cysteine cluster protein n=1 Tax=Cymbomonas tetramitiformis TaxID=36881 RepID=A0AAE0BBS7_9CHLO|nr:hypothetical protein CYMTET_56009 [Cymbomonas tetramitiformis]KAK3242409.1 hypothetical protein CYMTET_47903 [Cymbomonas tetramitiformis]
MEGRRFACTQCGKCCTGSGEVHVNNSEIAQMARFLRISEKTFVKKFCKAFSPKEGWQRLKSLRNPTNDCVFLENKMCILHSVRPLQCKTYPWWPSLQKEDDWILESKTMCEGIANADAPNVDAADAAHQLQLYRKYLKEREAAPLRRKRHTK